MTTEDKKIPTPCNVDTESSYWILGGHAIVFQPCGIMSYNRNDIHNQYCGHCHRFIGKGEGREALRLELHEYLTIRGKECEITIEPRPGYCDRGNYYAKLFTDGGSQLQLSIDYQDAWPRYYFDLDRAKLEIEAWIKKRGQFINDQWKLRSINEKEET